MVTFFQRTTAAVVVDESASFVEVPGAQKCLRLAGRKRRRWELLGYPMTREELGKRLAGEFAVTGKRLRRRRDAFWGTCRRVRPLFALR